MKFDKKNILKNSLYFHYLRPDNALWIYSIYESFYKYFNKYLNEKYISLDIGCGDGTSTFIASGGRLNNKLDAFMGYNFRVEKFIERFSKSGSLKTSKSDFYDFKSNLYQNYCKSSYNRNKFTIGIDWKKSLLEKASYLNFYLNLIQADCNNLPLKIKDNHVDFIFSTIIYWLKEPHKILKEINRILSEKGKFIFFVPCKNILKYTAANFLKKSFKKLNEIDRGRHKNWRRHAKDEKEWRVLLKKNNFRIIDEVRLHPTNQIVLGETIIRTLVKSHKVFYEKLIIKDPKIFFDYKKSYVNELYDILSVVTDKNYYNKLEKTYVGFICEKN